VKEGSVVSHTVASGHRLHRRSFLSGAGAAVLAAHGFRRPAAAHTPANVDDLAGVEWPPAVGQADIAVYVAATGHSLQGALLDYWRANGAAFLYGYPISEPFAAPNGYYSQAFERGILQYRPEFLYTADPIMRLMPVAQLAMLDRLRRSPDWRQALNAALPLWTPLEPANRAVAAVLDLGGVYVAESGHTISGDILAWYAFNEGAFYLGPPLSEPASDRGTTSQWFTGGLLEANDNGVTLAPLGRSLARSLGVSTAPVARDDLPLYDESYFWTAPNPNPLGDPYAPGAKWIEVNLSQQLLTAYHGTTPISRTLVSTGLDPNPTETGMFHVRLKYPVQDMQGFTSASGEVIAVGNDAAPEDAVQYAVEDVPNILYFNMQGEALHGTYWHNNFGEPMSHGCVNLPLDFAAWLYGWAPLGTGVWVHS
jgi:hypothetical protein